ncbi:molybdate ABC transporter substrate-binding protein [Pilimelia columellifera subsp. columellifera]|uniref:Molybdate ABC transporter substrate-binding protein n=1 Tax=Pilimelia columellifera subsp. columellifera TaxID=706583 RepID=A0ABP6ARC0_9ACTN
MLAASSLTEVFDQIGADFAAENQSYAVRFAYAGSSVLAAQARNGAPADVIALASAASLAPILDETTPESRGVTFARNQLVIAVPEGNPARVTRLADLGRPGTRVALCAEQVPCGALAVRALAAGRVIVRPVTLEQDVKAALSKVAFGEADAALVYRTDAAAAADRVDAVEFAEASDAVTDYPIAVLRGAPHAAGARVFVDFVLSESGRQRLRAAGFGLP